MGDGKGAAQAKPSHLGPRYAAQFQDQGVVAAYEHRAPIPPGVFDIVRRLSGERAPRVLDLGTGRGEMARPIAEWAVEVQAVDASHAMIQAGRNLPGGDRENLRWIAAPAEEAPLVPPYDLEIAASSLHWMDWDRMLPLLADALSPGGWLVLVDSGTGTVPWEAELKALIIRHSTNREFRPYDLVAELSSRGLFALRGEEAPPPVPYETSVVAYIEAFHSQNGFVRSLMGAEGAVFDEAVERLTAPWARNGRLTLSAVARVRWGLPLRGPGQTD